MPVNGQTSQLTRMADIYAQERHRTSERRKCVRHESTNTANAAVPAQASELPQGFFELVDDLKSLVRGAHARAQLKVNTGMIQMRSRWRAPGRSKMSNKLLDDCPGAMPGADDLSRVADKVPRSRAGTGRSTEGVPLPEADAGRR